MTGEESRGSSVSKFSVWLSVLSTGNVPPLSGRGPVEDLRIFPVRPSVPRAAAQDPDPDIERETFPRSEWMFSWTVSGSNSSNRMKPGLRQEGGVTSAGQIGGLGGGQEGDFGSLPYFRNGLRCFNLGKGHEWERIHTLIYQSQFKSSFPWESSVVSNADLKDHGDSTINAGKMSFRYEACGNNMMEADHGTN